MYRDSAHAAIAFNTLDRGILYFEPQTDEEVKLAVGKRYSQEVIPEPGYYISISAYDDTVLNFIINW